MKSAMEPSFGGKHVEMMLWHGTSSDAVDQFNENGSNQSYFGKNGQLQWL